MQTIRSFIAIELSDEARSVLADLQNRLKAVVPPKTVRWTAPQNIHLTLHFLGDVEVNEVEQVSQAVKTAASNCRPFSLTLTGLGCFPNTRRPRIVWVGVRDKTETLVALHQNLGEGLNVINFKPEDRPYSPHLTIGRVKNGLPRRQLTQLGEVLDQEIRLIGELATLNVAELSLIKSELTPSGPVYTPLTRAAFQS
jgi:2'-5' RNA ligase